MFIVTDCTIDGNNIPMIFDTFQLAEQCMKERAYGYITDRFNADLPDDLLYDEAHNLITDDAEECWSIVLDYAESHGLGVTSSGSRIEINYDYEDFNIIEIFDI